MTKNRIAIIALAAAAMLGTAACGEPSTDAPTAPEDSVKWFSTTDPITGDEYRCIERYVNSGNGRGAGISVWCNPNPQ